MSKKPEMETVTIQVPKSIMDFLRLVETDPVKYLEYSLKVVVQSDINSDGVWGPQEISKRFNLESVFKNIEN